MKKERKHEERWTEISAPTPERTKWMRWIAGWLVQVVAREGGGWWLVADDEAEYVRISWRLHGSLRTALSEAYRIASGLPRVNQVTTKLSSEVEAAIARLVHVTGGGFGTFAHAGTVACGPLFQHDAEADCEALREQVREVARMAIEREREEITALLTGELDAMAPLLAFSGEAVQVGARFGSSMLRGIIQRIEARRSKP